MGAFSVGFSVWFAHAVLRYSLPGAAAHLALLFLLGGAAARVAGARVPSPQVPLTREVVQQAAAVFGAAAGAWVERANVLLKWEDGAASARALAYAYLAYVCLPAVSAASVLTAWVAAFIIAPLYAQLHGPIDAALEVAAAGSRAAAAALGAAGAAVGAQLASPVGTAMVAGGALVAVYLLWGAVSFYTMCFCACPDRGRRWRGGGGGGGRGPFPQPALSCFTHTPLPTHSRPLQAHASLLPRGMRCGRLLRCPRGPPLLPWRRAA